MIFWHYGEGFKHAVTPQLVVGFWGLGVGILILAG